jgi:hypothetical protein
MWSHNSTKYLSLIFSFTRDLVNEEDRSENLYLDFNSNMVRLIVLVCKIRTMCTTNPVQSVPVLKAALKDVKDMTNIIN